MNAEDGYNGKPAVRILTLCAVGISRSVGLADVLKLHFSPVDVIPAGVSRNANSDTTLHLLLGWADHVIIMTQCLIPKLEKRLSMSPVHSNVHLCEVGEDIYGGKNRPILIDKVWRWTRANQHLLGITETH